MPVTTPDQDRIAYEMRVAGRPQSYIARFLGITSQQAAHAVTRHARVTGSPDPVRRRSVREAARYASAAGLPFDADAFASLNEQVEETIGGALFTGRTFGIEIEFRRPRGGLSEDAIIAALTDAGVNAVHEQYSHTTRPHWKLIYDGSSDKELVSPVLSGREGLREVRNVMRVLRELHCRVTSAEGMHVHVYAGDLPALRTAAIYRFYAERQGSIDMLTPRGRCNTYYARHIHVRDAERVEAYARQGSVVAPTQRYVTVNLESYSRYQTVEFRQHAGTLNGRKACDWVEFLLAIATLVERNEESGCPTDLWGTLDFLVTHHVLTRATADRLTRKAAGYGHARPAVADASELVDITNSPVPDVTVHSPSGDFDGVYDAWEGCACDSCSNALGRDRVRVHRANGTTNTRMSAHLATF